MRVSILIIEKDTFLQSHCERNVCTSAGGGSGVLGRAKKSRVAVAGGKHGSGQLTGMGGWLCVISGQFGMGLGLKGFRA